jgi:hypothetical protein
VDIGITVIFGILIYALVFGGGTAIVAESKGRSMTSWFVGGVILGPYATLIVGLSEPNRAGPGWLRCGYCFETFRRGATRCPHCTSEVNYPG